MDRKRVNRGLTGAVLALLVGLGLVLAGPAAAQQVGGPYKVLVPRLQPQGGADDDFGYDVAEVLRERIAQLARYDAVSDDALGEALDQYGIDEEDLSCIKARQLALQMNYQLVLCGSYQPAGGDARRVTARFISATSGNAFEVPAFRARDAGQAARQITSSFQRYSKQLRLTTYCLDYLKSKQYDAALENCNEALAISPTSVPALYAKARALMGEAEALTAGTSATAGAAAIGTGAAMDTLTADAGISVTPSADTMTDRREKLLEQSFEVHQKVLQIDPVHENALLTAGIVATKLNRQDVARDYFRQYLELNPNSEQVRLKVAIDMSQAGDPAGALHFIEEGMTGDSLNLTLAEYAGHFALNAAQQAETQDPAEASALYQTALDYYEQVFEAKGREASAGMLRKMLVTLLKLDRSEEAAQLGARIVEAKPESAQLWSAYARALKDQGRLEEAIAALETVLALNPDYTSAYSRRAVWLAQTGNLAEAGDAIQTAVEHGTPADKLARAVFAHGYNNAYKQGDYGTALDFFALTREFATRPTTRAMANFWSGYILYQRGKQISEARTAASAEQALPLFQNALDYFEQSGAYARSQSGVNLQEIIKSTKQYVAIQQALIQRGR